MDAYTEERKEYFELMAYATKVGVYNANSGKSIKIYEDNKKVIVSTQEEKEATLNYLTERFK